MKLIRQKSKGRFLVFSLISASLLMGPQILPAHGGTPEEEKIQVTRVWLGADGQPLPFKNDREICDFLRTANVLEQKEPQSGNMKAMELVLEKDGARVNAAFYNHHVLRASQELKDGRRIRRFRDSYRNPVAAYELSRLLNLRNVPPAVLRTIDGKEGSVQVLIPNSISEMDRAEKRINPPNPSVIMVHVHDMRVFDNLIANADRNGTNIYYDSDWNVWYGGHTMAFDGNPKLSDKVRLVKCCGPLWKRLRSLDPQIVRNKLEPYMDSDAIRQVLVRRHRIIQHIEKRIKREGKEAVIL